MADTLDHRALPHDVLGEEKARRELEVIARCPHRHGNRFVADANLQRLFDSDEVEIIAAFASVTGDRQPPYWIHKLIVDGGITSAAAVPARSRTSARPAPEHTRRVLPMGGPSVF